MGTITDFKSKLTGGGARPSQYRVRLKFPDQITNAMVAAEKSQFLCKSASLPASTIENIQLKYRGRQVNLAGEPTFEPWEISIYNDTSFDIRDVFERWFHMINKYNATCGTTNPADYQVDLFVDQLGKCDEVLKTYKFVDAYPINIGVIELSYESTGEIEVFPVQFQYNYFEPSNILTS